ncbi:MAG: diguanylate cyclase [Solirubrobacterales bacterium]|nr:diguanylate cyclase [Solirubrobacterales bacterium]
MGGAGLDDAAYAAVVVLAAVACGVRCVRVPVERRAWGMFTVALSCWAAAELHSILVLADMEITPFPSLSDVFFVAFYPACLLGLVDLVQHRVRAIGMALVLDGLVAALAVCAVGAALVFDSVITTLAEGTGTLPFVFNLAYPVGDLVLLGAVAGASSLTGWRPGRTLAALGGGLLLVAFGDGAYLVQTVAGTYAEGGWVDATWPMGLALVAWAAGQPARPVAVEFDGWRMLALPIGISLAAVCVLTAAQLGEVNSVATVLALMAVLAIIARMVWSLHDNNRLLAAARTEALTDPLTGLGNRRALLVDLERAARAATADAPVVLVLCDLDGFKDYNDTFGHPAGDALLHRRGRALRQAVGRAGTAYRPGGDEFCVLLQVSDAGAEAQIAACVDALTEETERRVVRPSFGACVVPAEARTVNEALRVADERMYAFKGRRRSSGRRQSVDVLLGVLREREEDLHEHSSGVAELALRVGRRLGMGAEELEEIAWAAELHDIGKVAVPEHILNKPAPLSTAEWGEMHKHTIIGERILRAAPALAPVGRLVRASHERWDGRGYPDGVAGEDIPLGARIVAVCDAFDAMTSDRPYRASIGAAAAVDELRRCAGTQFDPGVVEAFCAEVGAGEPDVPVAQAA